jgi:hypothetical protein
MITFITAIPAAVILYVPVLDDPRYIVGAGGPGCVRGSVVDRIGLFRS